MAAPELLATVIIPAYRRPEKLKEAVRSVLQQDLPPDQYEVIVVDSSAEDTNVRNMAELQQEARCSLRCFNKKPEGPGPSRNLGAREARGKYLAFMDSDCRATPQWLREGLAKFEERVGLVQGRTRPEPDVPKSVFNFTLQIEEESFLYHSANIIYRREAFEAAGGFLADMNPHSERPMGGEDVDLAWQVKNSGWESRFAPEALIYHEVVRISTWRWLCEKRLFICPRIVQKHPDLRRFFYARYFFDNVQAWLTLALAGIGLAPIFLPALVLTVPYIYTRVAEPSGTLRGPLRLARVMMYFPKDLVSMALLIGGSVRFRSLLL